MTINDQNIAMADDKRIGVAQLKAQLSEHLRSVEDGESIVVMNHKRPIARLVPYEDVPAWKRRARPPLIPGHAGRAFMELLEGRERLGPEPWEIVQEFLRDDRNR
jgi:prevent-host-death family protein